MARSQRGGPPATKLQAVRVQQGRSQDQVIRLVIMRASLLNIAVASESSLKVMLSRWENGHDQVTEPGYRRLFREIYGRTNEELGFPSEVLNEGAAELRDRLIVARSIDGETLDLFQQQVNMIRGSDKRFGAIAALDQLSSLIKHMEEVHAFSVNAKHRKRLAAILTDARTLAGWNALDRGSQLQAWKYHEDAKVSAGEAGAPHLLAHAAAQQAVILLDLGDATGAVELLEYARSVAENKVPAVLQSWLAAAHGEGLAAAGRRNEALRAFDQADEWLPADPVDPEMPFLLLNSGQLARWRGNGLTKLGEQEAIEQLEAAARELESPNGTAIREGSAIRGLNWLYVDLAFAYSAAGDREAAIAYAQRARRLASQIGSDRQRQRLESLILPGASGTTIA